MDVGGSSDPLTVISFGPQSFRTTVQRKSLAPVWNEELRIPVFEHGKGYTFVFSVYDHDDVSTNDFIGRAEVASSTPLHALLLGGTEQDVWLDLFRGKGLDAKKAGQLHVKVKLHSKSELTTGFWTKMAKFFDADGDQVIGKEELTAMLLMMNAQTSPEEIDRVYATADANQDGTVSYAELVDLMSGKEWTHPLFANFNKCPVTGKVFNNPSDAEVVCHLGMVFETHFDGASKFLMGGFLSEEFASQHTANTGAAKSDEEVLRNPEFVLVMDRKTGKVEQEFIPTTIRMALRSLYQTSIGSKAANTERVRKLLRNMTEKYGVKYTDPKSVEEIPKFVALHHLDRDEILDPLESFKNFNEFFYRKLKPTARPIAALADPHVITSPADCRCVVFETVSDATRIWIKGQKFSVAGLLGDAEVAKQYEGGALAIFRLAPQDYHRIHVPVDGVIGKARPLGQDFFTVNPMAIRMKQFDVYTDNKRVVTEIHTDLYGTVQYISVGATMVGSINIEVAEGQRVAKGDTFGYFAFGGSTVICLWKPNTLVWDTDLITNSQKPLETLIAMGQQIAVHKSRVPQAAPADLPAAASPQV
eukprot:TRINITY_DN15013_c0_g1_i1.p1 TRINITY_DN15013_c0_g1~~TRINITY_DN15013_c0_g1_i1.p1  ORF type:complete len:652 (+),score=158.48 TRINITY_DN15013_c0_g1_i1:195-1958(+)